MRILMVLKNDMRKRRGQSVVILLLSLLITVLLATTVSVLWKSNRLYDDTAQKLKTPEVVNIYSAAQQDEGVEVFKKLEKQSEVKSAFLEDILLMTDNNSVKMGSNDWYSSSVFLRVIPEEYTLEEGERQKDGIYLPISLKSGQQMEIGDLIVLKFGDTSLELPVAGFFEDPFLGGTMIGFKQLFLEEEYFQSITRQSYSDSYQGKLLGMWLEPHEGTSYASVMKELNERTKVTSSGIMYTEIALLKTATMLMSDIFLGLIFLFGMLLLIILLITVRYMLASSLEDDFKEIGVLHSLGYTKRVLVTGKMLQIFLLSAAGGLLGFICSMYTIPVLGGYALDGTGILWHGGVELAPAILAVLAVFLFILFVTWMSLRRIRKISTVQAIRNGNEDVYFKKRYQIPLERLSFLPLPVRMAVKNMSVRLPQFLLLVIVCGFMVFSMVSISALNENMHDLKKISVLFGSTISDISVVDRAEKTEENAEKFEAFMEEVKKQDNVQLVYSSEHEYMSIDGQKMLLSAVSEFADGNYQEPLEGRIPKYDNEIMTTEIAADYLGKKIGDTVEIQNGERTSEYLITGYYQSSNDAGKIACVTAEGYKRLVPDFHYSTFEVLQKDGADLKQTTKQIKTLAADSGMKLKIEDIGNEIESVMEEAQAGILALVILFYMLAVLMTGLITFLLATTLLKKQKREFAVQRSMGYPLRSLRLQFACSFGLAGLMGAVLGVAAVGLFTDRMFSALFGSIGITKFKADITAVSVGLPILILAGFLVLFSYLISRRIRKIGTRQLVEVI